MALPSTPAFLGKDLEDFPLCPQRHISTQKSTGSALRARRNQPSKCALVTASPALANTNNCRLNKRSRVELSTGSEALASTDYRRPSSATPLSRKRGSRGPRRRPRGSLRPLCAPWPSQRSLKQTEVVPHPGNSASPAQHSLRFQPLSKEERKSFCPF